MGDQARHSVRHLVAGVWQATDGSRGRFLLFVLLFVAAQVFDLLTPWAIGYTLGIFVERGFSDEAYRLAVYGVGAYIALRLLYTVTHHLGRYIQLSVSYGARMTTIEGPFSQLLRFPLSWHVQHHSGESLSKLHRSAGAVDVTVGTYVWQAIEGLAKVVFASIALIALDQWVALNVIAMGVLTILAMLFFNSVLVRSIRENNAFQDRLNRVFVDYLYNIITVKSLGLEHGAESYLQSRRLEGERLNRRIVRFSELKWGSVGVGYSLVMGSSLLIYFYAHRGLSGAFDVAQVYVLLNYLDRIFQAVGSLTAYYSGLLESATAYEDATKIATEASALPVPASAGSMPREWRELELRNVFFRYSDDTAGGVHGVSLTIRRGEKIALVGPSGSGKSTLLKLLGGLLIAERGEVLLDGSARIDLRMVAAQGLTVPQEPEIFSETVLYNLTMGDKFAPHELNFFLQLCRADEILTKLPQGWDSSLAESGMNLSVGEKQRIALARALIRARERQIILLDEPTSSLDPTTEKRIFEGILVHFTDRTIITACHRLALAPQFHRIVFMRNGRIEEQGTFDELLSRRGPFAQAWADYQVQQAVGAQV